MQRAGSGSARAASLRSGRCLPAPAPRTRSSARAAGRPGSPSSARPGRAACPARASPPRGGSAAAPLPSSPSRPGRCRSRRHRVRVAARDRGWPASRCVPPHALCRKSSLRRLTDSTPQRPAIVAFSASHTPRRRRGVRRQVDRRRQTGATRRSRRRSAAVDRVRWTVRPPRRRWAQRVDRTPRSRPHGLRRAPASDRARAQVRAWALVRS